MNDDTIIRKTQQAALIQLVCLILMLVLQAHPYIVLLIGGFGVGVGVRRLWLNRKNKGNE